MPTDVSRSHDGEKQRSDQAPTRRDASPNNGRIRDFATLPFQRQDAEHQRNEKSIMTPEMENQYTQDKQERCNNNHRKAIQEIIEQRHGKTSPQSEIPLGYKKERYPMRGRTLEEAQAYLDSLSVLDKKEFEICRDTGVGSQRGDEIYRQWSEKYTNVSREREEEITKQVEDLLRQHGLG
jgi:hypothetical protein